MTEAVITGIGCVSALGLGADALWSAARDGHSGVDATNFERTPSRVRIAAMVDREALAERVTEEQRTWCDPFTQASLVAAEEMMADARMDPGMIAGSDTAVIVGSSIGGIGTLDESLYRLYALEDRNVGPTTIPRVMSNAPASHITMTYGITGPSFCISTACASGTQSIGVAASLIRSGAFKRVITGGSDVLVTPGMLRAWEMMRVLTPKISRPFSIGRNGMVLGEGAGIFLIEAEEEAARRGATVRARIAGYGTTSDAGHLLRPDPAGCTNAMMLAIKDGQVSPDAIGYVNAHGTGTVLNDKTETAALHNVFGSHIENLKVSSTKPIHGHALGASGALELVLSIKALEENFAPPTINFTDPCPDCNLNAVPNTGQPFQSNYVMSNSFAFGGINASLLVARPQ